MSKLKGNLLVSQSGGPTAVINTTLRGVIEEAKKHGEIQDIYGAYEGIKGFMDEEIIDLRAETFETIAKLTGTPSSILGSCRKKLVDEDLEKIFKIIEAHNIRYFYIIGGNDTQDTANRVSKFALAQNYEIKVAGLPKTVDNDLLITDHTPGYGSAARYTAITVMDLDRELDALKSKTPVTILETFGQTNGWLPASGSAAKQKESDAPHLIYTSEKNISLNQILSDVQNVYKALGKVLVIVGEGVCDETGKPYGLVAAEAGGGFDAKMYGEAAINLRRLITVKLGLGCRACIPGAALQNSIMCQSQSDAEEAYALGAWAVERTVVQQETDFMPAIVRDSDEPYKWHIEPAPLEKVANYKKDMPKEYINEAGNFVTEEFMTYIKPLVGPLPDYAILKDARIAKKLNA